MITIQLEEENIIPGVMIEDLGCVLNNIEELKNSDYLKDHQNEDLMYDLNLLRAIKTIYKFYTVHTEWDLLDLYQVKLDHDLTETDAGV